MASAKATSSTEMTEEELNVKGIPDNLLKVADLRVGQSEFEMGLPTADGSVSDVTCPYCLGVPHHPASNEVCGHFACEGCLEKAWIKNKDTILQCTSCRLVFTPNEITPFAKLQKGTKLLFQMKLEVRCTNKDGGRECNERGSPFVIDEHRVMRCRLRLVWCPNFHCTQRMACDRLVEHLNTCTLVTMRAGKVLYKTPPALVRSTLADTLLRLQDTQPFPSRHSDSENEDDAARRFEDRCEAARQARPDASGTNEIPSPPTNPFIPLPLPSFMLSRSHYPVGLGATTRPHLRSLQFRVRPPLQNVPVQPSNPIAPAVMPPVLRIPTPQFSVGVRVPNLTAAPVSFLSRQHQNITPLVSWSTNSNLPSTPNTQVATSRGETASTTSSSTRWVFRSSNNSSR